LFRSCGAGSRSSTFTAGNIDHQLGELSGIAGTFSALSWHGANMPGAPSRFQPCLNQRSPLPLSLFSCNLKHGPQESCDELRGGMDASQYKDYVLVLLFVKYVSDRYAGEPYAPISIPAGASFADMVALKGKTDIGDQINKKILGPLAQANSKRRSAPTLPHAS